MKLKLFITLITCLLSFSGYCQTNLISNGGFESTVMCPNFGGQINYATNWNNVNLVYGSFSVGTPDYFNTCGSGTVVPPNTFAGQCNPHTGGAMAALVMYNSPYPDYREYMSSPLTCPMVAGNTYTVSFWLTNGISPISQYKIRNIGIHFSVSPLTQSGYSIINVVPQLELTTLVGSTSWAQYTFTIIATSNWQYMTVGAFQQDSQNLPTASYPVIPGPASVYANYFFDDFEVFGVNGIPTLAVTSSVTNVKCEGGSTGAATITPAGGSYNYLWSPGSYTTSIVSNLSAGVYTVNVSDSNCGSGSTVLSVLEPLALTASLSASSYTTCGVFPIELIAHYNGGTPNYAISWSNGISNTNSITVSPLVNTIYSYTITDANNCTTTEIVAIQVNPVFSSFNYSSSLCSSVVSFTNNSLNSASVYWDFGDNQGSSSGVTVHNYQTAGIYTVSLISTSILGCKDTLQKTITIDSNYVNPDFDFVVTKAICIDSVSFINKSLGSTSQKWMFGDGSISFQNEPSHHFPIGNYTITLIVSNSSCLDSISKNLTSTGLDIVNEHIPNVFTPNNDGTNDVFDFKILGTCHEYNFEIFDRWGLSIFKPKVNTQTFWDGRTTSGEMVPDGTYFYIMNMNGNGYKGTVTVFR